MKDCLHTDRRDGVCVICGHCRHDVILNHRCYFCGATNIDVTIKASGGPAVVPASRLAQRGKGRGTDG